MWRRKGLALLLTLATVYLFVSATLPALRERNALRAMHAAEEREHEALLRQERELRLLLDWVETDALLRERLIRAQTLSPDVMGPVPAAALREGDV